ncbi:hypothetical protein ABIA28_002558 [Bradyrhizobium elkanii]
MQIGTILDAVERLDRTTGNRLGERQAGEVQFAVDQHAAGTAAALAAAELGRHVADQLAQRDQKVGAAVNEDRDVTAVMLKLNGSLGHDDYS